MSSSAPSELPTAAPTEGHDDVLVVAFTAPWCGHCRAMLPDLRQAAAAPGAPRLDVIDVTDSPDAAAVHGVTGTPTVVGFRGGVEAGRMVGRKGPAEIRAFFDSTAAGTRHRRSQADLVIRGAAGVIVGVLGWVLDASPLLAFAAVILATIGVSEWRARRA